MRIIVFTITAAIQLAAALVGFLVLLLGLNGYSEKQAMPGLIFYIVLGLGSAPAIGMASAFTSKRLDERKLLGSLAASALSIIVFTVLGALILVLGFIAALLLAESIRGFK